VKYADFGLACTKKGFFDNGSITSCERGACGKFCGTLGWVPPEEISSQKDVQSQEGDLWAVGSMLYWIWTGRFVPDSQDNGWTVLPTPDRTWKHPSEMTSPTGWNPPGDWLEGDWNQAGLWEYFDEAPHFDVDALPPILDLFGLRQDLSDLMAGLLAAKEERVQVLEAKHDILDRIVNVGACIRKLKPGTPPAGAMERFRRFIQQAHDNVKSVLKGDDKPSSSFTTSDGKETTGKIHDEGRTTSEEAMQMQQQGCSLPVSTMDELVIFLAEAEDAFGSLYSETIQLMKKDERRPWVDRNGVAHYAGPAREAPGSSA